MKPTIKTHSPGVQAMLIYRQIKKLRDDLNAEIEKQGFFIKFQKNIEDLLKKDKINLETFKILQILMGQERSMTTDEKISLVADKAVEKQKQFTHHLESNHIPLYLTISGDLYKKPKEQFCYQMHNDSCRLAIVRALIGYSTFRDPKETIKEVPAKSYTSFTGAIGQINRKAHNLLHLPDGKENYLIISKNGSGYMINPLYAITQEN